VDQPRQPPASDQILLGDNLHYLAFLRATLRSAT
jgi:hypothetical protein